MKMEVPNLFKYPKIVIPVVINAFVSEQMSIC